MTLLKRQPCSGNGCDVSYYICSRNSRCNWHHSGTKNCCKSATSSTAPTQTPYTVYSIELNHCRLRRPWCEARGPWRTEQRSSVCFYESRFCLSTSDHRVLVRRRISGTRNRPICGPDTLDLNLELCSREQVSYDTRSNIVVISRTLTENVYVSLVIKPVFLPS